MGLEFNFLILVFGFACIWSFCATQNNRLISRSWIIAIMSQNVVSQIYVS